MLNERFATSFILSDHLFFDQVMEEAKADGTVVQQADTNAFNNFALVMRSKIEGLVLDRLAQRQGIVTKYLNEQDFQDAAFKEMARRIYTAFRLSRSPVAGLGGTR